MKPTTFRVLMLPMTTIAHGEIRHRSVRTVVRHSLNDRVTRPAFGAGREWVTVPRILQIKHISQTRRANGPVRRYSHGGATCSRLAGKDLEATMTFRLTHLPLDCRDVCRSRR